MQIRCSSCMYSQTFFPSAVRLWNLVPSDTCYLAPDSFKVELSKINLIWSRTEFLSHRTARSYFLEVNIVFTQHRIPQHMTSTRSAILLYTTELALVSEDEDINKWNKLIKASISSAQHRQRNLRRKCHATTATAMTMAQQQLSLLSDGVNNLNLSLWCNTSVSNLQSYQSVQTVFMRHDTSLTSSAAVEQLYSAVLDPLLLLDEMGSLTVPSRNCLC